MGGSSQDVSCVLTGAGGSTSNVANCGCRSNSSHGPVSGQLACPQDMVSGFPRMGVGVGMGGLTGSGGRGRDGERGAAELYFFMTQKSQSIIFTTPFARRESLRPANVGELGIGSHFLQKGLSKMYLKITILWPTEFSTDSRNNVSYAPCSSRTGLFRH